jgi:hypothetical protein
MSELNPIAALSTALLSSVVGFGLAFYIAVKINKGMLSKAQKALVFVAMTSFGVGLTGILNEIIGLPLQGLSIRGEKVYQYVLANIFTVPMLLGIAFFLKNRMRQCTSEQELELVPTSLTPNPQNPQSSHSYSNRKNLAAFNSIFLLSALVLTMLFGIWFASDSNSDSDVINKKQTQIETQASKKITNSEWIILDKKMKGDHNSTIFYDGNSITKISKSNYIVTLAEEFDIYVKVRIAEENRMVDNVKHFKQLIEFDCKDGKSKLISSDFYSSSPSDFHQIRLNTSSYIATEGFESSATAKNLCRILVGIK